MSASNAIQAAMTALTRWLIDSSIERGRPLPGWLSSRLKSDAKLARYERSARKVDRQLRRGSARFRAPLTTPSNPAMDTYADRASRFEPMRLWRSRLAAAAVVALLLIGAAQLVRDVGSDRSSDSEGVAAATNLSADIAAGSTVRGSIAPTPLRGVIVSARDALAADNLPLVVEARRLADDGRELGRHFLELIPVRSVGLLRRHGLDTLDGSLGMEEGRRSGV